MNLSLLYTGFGVLCIHNMAVMDAKYRAKERPERLTIKSLTRIMRTPREALLCAG
jgi:hypothetical protein